MTGEYQHSIDTKGRLFIPASLREELGDTIYVTISIERALAAYSEEAWREKEEKFNALPSAQARRIRPLFVNGSQMHPGCPGTHPCCHRNCAVMRD